MRFRLSILAVTLVLFVAVPGLAQKRNITEKDLFNFVWMAIRKYLLTVRSRICPSHSQ